MRSFVLSSLIPVALGIFAFAAPAPIDIDLGTDIDIDLGTDIDIDLGTDIDIDLGTDIGAGLDSDIDLAVDIGLGLNFDDGVYLIRRGGSGGLGGGPIDVGALAGVDGEKSLESILCGVVSSVDALVDEISNLGAVGCTVETLDLILTEVKDILTGAIDEVNGLKGVAVETILNSDDGLLDATGLSKLLADVVVIVVKLVKLVLNLVSSVVKDDVLSLLIDILCLVGKLLKCVLSLVDSALTGVLAILGVLVKDVLSIFVQLKIQIVIDLFKLSIPDRVG